MYSGDFAHCSEGDFANIPWTRKLGTGFLRKIALQLEGYALPRRNRAPLMQDRVNLLPYFIIGHHSIKRPK